MFPEISDYVLSCSFGLTEGVMLRREAGETVVDSQIISSVVQYVGLSHVTTDDMLSYIWHHCVRSSPHPSLEGVDQSLKIERVMVVEE